MELNAYLIYLAAILVLTASPGPSILLCITKSVAHGFHASVYAALGSLTAILGIMTLSFTGLGVLIASSEVAFNVVKWAGATYLIYLGLRTFFAQAQEVLPPLERKSASTFSKASLFFSGFLVGGTNPKAIVFFTALFPQFIDMGQPLLPQYALLVSTFAVLELGWLLLYAYFGAKSSSWLLASGRARMFNRVTGSVFIFAGVLLSVSRKTA